MKGQFKRPYKTIRILVLYLRILDWLYLLRCRYSPGWALASFTIHLQASRSLALSLHSFIPIFLRSVDTSSNHLIFGLPLRLVAYSFPYIFFGIAVSCILSIWPSHRILWPLMNLTMFSPLIVASNPSFRRILHNSFSFTGPYIFRSIFLSNTVNALDWLYRVTQKKREILKCVVATMYSWQHCGTGTLNYRQLRHFSNHGSDLKRQLIMVQFLSINFLLDFFNFCWVFHKFPFFFASSCIYVFVISNNKREDNRFCNEKVQPFHISNMFLISSWIQLSIGHFLSQTSGICHIFKGFILSGIFTLRFYLASCWRDTDVRI